MPPTCCRNDPLAAQGSRSNSTPRNWIQLAIGSTAILVLWLAVLPRIADQPAVRRHIEFLEQRHIDPSVMFYTELEPMADVRSRVTRIRRDHPEPFWQPQLGRDRSEAPERTEPRRP
ncbi:MAG: hypothetical protein MUE50_25830 [Pirellulaceae bacterium]|jgi:hypothetical protein|nr:hypothetical protein [Pirellulaceae bacterium]